MADADKTLVTEKSLADLITAGGDPTTGRVSIILNRGDSIQLGDSGLRDLTGQLTADVVSGKLTVRRIGSFTVWQAFSIVLAAGTSGNTPILQYAADLNPVRPATTIVQETRDGSRLAVSAGTTDTFIIQIAQPGIPYSGVVVHDSTQAWWNPNGLPGVADGDPLVA